MGDNVKAEDVNTADVFIEEDLEDEDWEEEDYEDDDYEDDDYDDDYELGLADMIDMLAGMSIVPPSLVLTPEEIADIDEKTLFITLEAVEIGKIEECELFSGQYGEGILYGLSLAGLINLPQFDSPTITDGGKARLRALYAIHKDVMNCPTCPSYATCTLAQGN